MQQTAQIAMAVSHAAALLGSTTERANALIEPLKGLLPFDGVWLALCDEARRGHRSVISTGWDAHTADYLDGPVLVNDIEQLGMTRSRVPLRVTDLPVAASELQTWAECLLPAGFNEGLGMCLFAADGRQIGFLGLFTESARVPSDWCRDLFAALGPTLAHAVDPLRSAITAAETVSSAIAGAILTKAGSFEMLPGLPGHPALRDGSPLFDAAIQTLNEPANSFLLPTQEEGCGHQRVTVMNVTDDPFSQVKGIVLLSPCEDHGGLTDRELEVLGQVIAGYNNAEAARNLYVSQRTIATHMEHILAKLDASSRTLAAVRAQKQGTYVPTTLIDS